MAKLSVEVTWTRNGSVFLDNKYSRAHQWSFDGGAVVPASSSPSIVPIPLSDPTAVDPEEAFMAAIASCHMLWFLSIAAKGGFTVERYSDSAIGKMEKNTEGRVAITEVELRPVVNWTGALLPTADQVDQMHHAAHEECFIANSVKTSIRIAPQ